MSEKLVAHPAGHVTTPAPKSCSHKPCEEGFSPNPIPADDWEKWGEMAKAQGIRMPPRTQACTTTTMERWLHRLGLSSAWFTDWSGFRSLSGWKRANPTWSLGAFVGLLLEELQ